VINILLTGASGFIGSNILEKIKPNNNIFVVSRSKKKIKKDNNIKYIKFDSYDQLSKKLKTIKIHTIIHCATHYKKKHEHNDIKKFIESNILLGNILLENLNEMKVKKFINFSTTWESSNNSEINPRNLYAAYKKSFFYILQYYKHLNPQIKFIDLIIADTFGRNDRRNKIINTLRENYKKNKITKIISKKLYLNLLNVKDIVDAIQIVLHKNVKSNRYILKNLTYINIHKLISNINKGKNKKIKVKYLSKIFIKDKFMKYKKLKTWKPKQSSLENIKQLILKE
jgi:nucleoside-diphosphate-sugar epimerase